jgi:8-oxo-dGTP pyrophosphatase MutT (NUDIX family)
VGRRDSGYGLIDWQASLRAARPAPTIMPVPCDDAAMDERPVATGPWLRHSRRVAYENAWITIWHDEVTRPDGAPGVYGIVHFANLAVGVVSIDADDRVLLVGQHRYALDEYSWEIPEGGVPDGESPLEGARRELREETGVDASDWVELARIHLSNSVSDELAILFLATGLTTGDATPDGTEALDVRWIPLDEVLAMTVDGRITDALTVLAIQRVAIDRMTGDRVGLDR